MCCSNRRKPVCAVWLLIAVAIAVLSPSGEAAAAIGARLSPETGSVSLSLLGTTALPFSSRNLDRQVAIARQAVAEPACVDPLSKVCGLWRRVVDIAKTMPADLRVQWIDYTVGKLVTYVADPKQKDHWALPAATMMSRTGDCEDIALLKLKLLAMSGIDPSKMAIVVVNGRAFRSAHAVLVVRLGERELILDNLATRVVSMAPQYVPAYAVSPRGSWIFGISARRPLRNVAATEPASARLLRPATAARVVRYKPFRRTIAVRSER